VDIDFALAGDDVPIEDMQSGERADGFDVSTSAYPEIRVAVSDDVVLELPGATNEAGTVHEFVDHWIPGRQDMLPKVADGPAPRWRRRRPQPRRASREVRQAVSARDPLRRRCRLTRRGEALL
jgi:hypothetical protein